MKNLDWIENHKNEESVKFDMNSTIENTKFTQNLLEELSTPRGKMPLSMYSNLF